MPVASIEVVYLYVRDLERSLTFYRDLGIPLVPCPYDPGWAEARLGGVRFALHAVHKGAEPRTPNSVRVSLRVDDVASEAERLRAAGVDVGEVQRESWGTLCEIRDPDGYELNLFAPPADVASGGEAP